MARVEVHDHPLSGTTLLPLLHDYLPASLPLYRRIQHESQSEHARILATFPPEARDRLNETGTNGYESKSRTDEVASRAATLNGDAEISFSRDGECSSAPLHFAVAYIDRSSRPETELFLFSSGEFTDATCALVNELPAISSSTSDHKTQYGPPQPCTCASSLSSTTEIYQDPYSGPANLSSTPCGLAIVALTTYIARHVSFIPLTPAQEEDAFRAASLVESLKTPSTAENDGYSSAKSAHYPAHSAFLTDVHKADILKFGSAGTLPTAVLAERQWLLRGNTGLEYPHWKFWMRAEFLEEMMRGRQLGTGLKWGDVREKDLDLVRIRTPIPRMSGTLRRLKGVSVWDGEEHKQPVAWAFIGKEGNLTSLHVEPQFRGRGVAKTLTAKLFIEGAEKDGWAHADVAVGNKESESVCNGLGATSTSRVWWLRVDLSVVRDWAEDV